MLRIRRFPFHFLAFTTTVLCAHVAAVADDALAARAQTLLDETRAGGNLAGMTAGIARNGEVVWIGASGYSDVENQIPATPDMVHRIASISKPITAVAAMQLVQHGRVALEDPVRKFVPEWPETPMGEIAILHLLTHTSGIKHYMSNDGNTSTNYPTLTDGVAFIKDRRSGIAFPPQDRYLYTTYGYAVLSLVIERASGVPFGEYMRDYVWLPAGMRHTSLEIVGQDIANKSKLYRLSADGVIEQDDPTDLSGKAGGGGFQSTAGDLLRFAIAFEGEKLVNRESMDRMMHIPPLNNPRNTERSPYGFGWNILTSLSLGNIIAHSGGQSGTSTYMLISRDHDIAVSVLCNTAGTGAPGDLAFALARLAASVPEPEPEPATN